MDISKKYHPLIIVGYFCVSGLLIAFLLVGIKTFLDEGSYFERLEAPFFMAIYAFIVGIIFCELRAALKSRLIGSVLFGVLSSQLFFIGLLTSTLVRGEVPKAIPLNVYLILTLFFTLTLAAVYFKVVHYDT